MHFKSPYFLRLAPLSFWILMIAVALHYFFKPKDTIDFRQYRTLASFQKGKSQTPHNRATEPFTPIVDTHMHFRPFGGKEIPFNELLTYFKKTSVRFVNVYGIGQRVPISSDCTYYLDCPNTPVLPTIKNDMANAEAFIHNKPEDIHLVISMTFSDLRHPDKILEIMKLYEKEYPGIFKWMGEINLIKQALLNNLHEPASLEDIKAWKGFMDALAKNNIPLNIHSDLGNDANPTEFLYLMDAVLNTYPNNKIIWAHMGLSKGLIQMYPDKHIELMQEYLDRFPNLMLDISWDILEKNYFSKYRSRYVDFFNAYSTRILPGSDFVAASTKNFTVYREELQRTSAIFEFLDDRAFRNIALGENYFQLLGLDYEAPPIVQAE